MRSFLLTVGTGLFLGLLLGSPPQAAAQKGRDAKIRPEKQSKTQVAVQAVVFSENDRYVVRQYFKTHAAGLPPGLAKRERLTPGHEKQLRRNGTLPPGLQKRVQPFPPDLVAQLPPIPEGYSRVIIAGRAVILDRHNRILDIMAIFRR